MLDRTAWLHANRALARAANHLLDTLSVLQGGSMSSALARAFLFKAVRGLTAVNALTRIGLWEEAQVHVRVLVETRISFDYFARLCADDETEASRRVVDSMMLEKVKQQRQSKYAGSPDKEAARRALEATEREIEARYSREELAAIRRNGFSGMTLEQRAQATGHDERYQIVYRNFSRNVHGTDFMEFFALHEQGSTAEGDDYRDCRDIVTLETAHSMVRGLALHVARVFGLPEDEVRRVPWLGSGPAPGEVEG